MNTQPKIISAKEARDNFADLLGMVYYGKESVIVEKQGRPFAVVVNPEQYEKFKQIAKERFFETVDKIQAKNKNVSPKKVLTDVTRVVEEVRQDLYEKEE
ncbi:MAG: type II toxin-antitoxin system Phd/YefM family antitoxin [Candidatus Daviesbacteria bacterium]|nr:type II toxin-antitoxin system Phd/YefM family antitoxin [Candidatus Daviesbacteria bacterium]